jgi:hypothetical protein
MLDGCHEQPPQSTRRNVLRCPQDRLLWPTLQGQTEKKRFAESELNLDRNVPIRTEMSFLVLQTPCSRLERHILDNVRQNSPQFVRTLWCRVSPLCGALGHTTYSRQPGVERARAFGHMAWNLPLLKAYPVSVCSHWERSQTTTPGQ